MRRWPNRVAVIGDVHACDRRLDLLLTHLDEQELEMVACVGDIVDGPGDPDATAALRDLPASVDVKLADGTRLVLCHGVLDNDMNKITADDYGYALEVNDELQSLLRDRRPCVVVKGHRHRPAIWTVGRLTLVDAGSLLEESQTCAVIVDANERTVTPIAVGRDGVKHWHQAPLFQA